MHMEQLKTSVTASIPLVVVTAPIEAAITYFGDEVKT
jgi:hypothetical protein